MSSAVTKPADKPDARQDQARNPPLSACAQITPKTADEYLVDGRLLGLNTAPATTLGHAATLATLATTTTTATAATLTPEAPAATVAATAAVTTTTALTLAAVAAGDGLETVVRRSGGGGGSGSRSGFGRLRVVVGPGLGGGGGGGGGRAGLGLAGLARDLDVHPLLGGGQLVARVPLALAGRVGGLVADLGVAGGRTGGGAARGRVRRRRRMAVGQRRGGTLVDLGQAGVGDGRVGLWLLLGLDGGLGLGFGVG